MSWLMVALIGPGKGPSIPLSKKAAVLRVSGHQGGVVNAYVDSVRCLQASGNGNYPLDPGEFVEVEYDGPSKSLIAEVVRET
jgi:hypothetical protein